jgi:glycosyltransferase involved in cell wall biosynthesis
VGDCCTDDTEERLRWLGDPRIRFSNLPVRVKYPEDPLLRWMVCGYAAAKRTLELAQGEWLAYMDDDDIWTPDHLEALLDFARAGDYELVYGRYRCEVSPGVWKERGGPRFPGGRRPYRLTGVPHLTVMIRSYLAPLKTYPLNHHEDVARYRLPLDNFTWQLMGRAGVRAGFLNQVVGIQALRPGETMLTPTAINTASLEQKQRIRNKRNGTKQTNDGAF